MRLSRILFAVPLFVAALALSPTPVQADDTEEFLRPTNWEGIKEYWSIEGTTIVGKAEKDPGFNTFFISKKKYGDFELSFQVRLTDGKGNSGVQIRSAVLDAKKFVVGGPQADIGAGYWGSLYGERVGGMMKQSPADLVKKAVKNDGFNDYKIVAKGNHITITVNGETMVDQDFAMTPDKKPMAPAGVIAFQLHAGGPMTVTYQNIKFKDLSKK